MAKLFTIALILFSWRLFAGPPYDTDDPEPVLYQHWEVYFSSHLAYGSSQWAGTAPHFEVNYGIIPGVQLHVIAPMAISAVKKEKTQYGYGDTELGAKIRFIKESKWCPEIGIFPLVELPTGNPDKSLGNGNTQVYIPLWLQKTFGKWTTYGGAGYWFNPGQDNRNWQFYGLTLQYQLLEKMSIGAELYHSTSPTRFDSGETRFNIGSVIDLNQTSHLLFSAGSSLNGSTKFQCYIGYQLTFGKNRA
jgi:hypothetical protein